MLNIKEVSKQTLERYSERYRQMGKDIKTLGWGTIEQQLYRFQQTLQATDFHDKSILDIGCGFADYCFYLQDQNLQIKSYVGWDINQYLINEAQEQIGNFGDLFVVDISDEENLNSSNNNYDIVVMLGLLNYNLKDESDNYTYSEQIIRNAFTLTNEVLIIDFLSIHKTVDYPSEDFVFYHDPLKIIDLAFKLSSNVVLVHNYEPIPQKEFMLFIYRVNTNNEDL
jgi:SAM-dependent methyltransferase